MTWWQASLFANVSIFALEQVYRRGTFDSFWSALPYIALPILAAQYGIYYCWRGAPSIFTAWALFSVANSTLRVVNAWWLKEPVHYRTLLCILGMYVCAYLIKGDK